MSFEVKIKEIGDTRPSFFSEEIMALAETEARQKIINESFDNLKDAAIFIDNIDWVKSNIFNGINFPLNFTIYVDFKEGEITSTFAFIVNLKTFLVKPHSFMVVKCTKLKDPNGGPDGLVMTRARRLFEEEVEDKLFNYIAGYSQWSLGELGDHLNFVNQENAPDYLCKQIDWMHDLAMPFAGKSLAETFNENTHDGISMAETTILSNIARCLGDDFYRLGSKVVAYQHMLEDQLEEMNSKRVGDISDLKISVKQEELELVTYFRKAFDLLFKYMNVDFIEDLRKIGDVSKNEFIKKEIVSEGLINLLESN